MRLMGKRPGIDRVAKIFMRNVREIVPEPWVSSSQHCRVRDHHPNILVSYRISFLLIVQYNEGADVSRIPVAPANNSAKKEQQQ